jgi:hypothetical protein
MKEDSVRRSRAFHSQAQQYAGLMAAAVEDMLALLSMPPQ